MAKRADLQLCQVNAHPALGWVTNGPSATSHLRRLGTRYVTSCMYCQVKGIWLYLPVADKAVHLIVVQDYVHLKKE